MSNKVPRRGGGYFPLCYQRNEQICSRALVSSAHTIQDTTVLIVKVTHPCNQSWHPSPCPERMLHASSPPVAMRQVKGSTSAHLRRSPDCRLCRFAILQRHAGTGCKNFKLDLFAGNFGSRAQSAAADNANAGKVPATGSAAGSGKGT